MCMYVTVFICVQVAEFCILCTFKIVDLRVAVQKEFFGRIKPTYGY